MLHLVSMRNNLYSIYANNRRIYLLLYFYTVNRLFSIPFIHFSKTSQIHKLINVLKYLDMSTRIFVRVPTVNNAERLDGVLVRPL